MIFRKATLSDLDGILLVEKQAFIPQIQERRTVFAQRLSAYPAGFVVLEDNAMIAGYFSSELWNSVPSNKDSFCLGHSAEKSHSATGTVLYISSVALRNEYKNKGLGTLLFQIPLIQICTHNSAIKQSVLLVNDSWKGAYHIYKKSGFSEYAKLKDFFPTQENSFTDGILMSAERAVINSAIKIDYTFFAKQKIHIEDDD